MIKALPFGNFEGFSDGKRSREYYFSQSMSKSRFGIMPVLSITKRKDDSDISGLGKVNFFAQAGAETFCVDNNGKVYKEGGTDYSFALDRTPANTSHGNGLLGDNKGRLLYAQDRYLGKLEGGTYTDSWKDFGASFSTTDYRDGDNYQGGSYFMNANNIAYLASDDSWNAQAFTMPTGFAGRAIRSGRNGILAGWNIGSQGVLTLWDAGADRSIAPWIWTNGKIQSIERYNEDGWLVVTEKAIILTTGYAAQVLYTILDDPLNLGAFNVLPRGTWINGDQLFIMNTANETVPNTSRGFNRLRSGLLIFNLPSRTFEYSPISTGNTYDATPLAILSNKGSAQRILVSYRDENLAKNYIGSIEQTGAATALYITEPLADSPTEKVAEAVILNIGTETYQAATKALTFSVAAKLYTFKRQLWQQHSTNATGGFLTLRVDGTTNVPNAKVQVGDEVTILNGAAAGTVRHIVSIAGQGTNIEEWTLDSNLPSVIGSGIRLQVQPFKLIQKKTFSDISELKELYFDVKNKLRGKKFLIKILFENMTVQPELHNGVFVYDDLGLLSG